MDGQHSEFTIEHHMYNVASYVHNYFVNYAVSYRMASYTLIN